jgi:hypothetical protein
MKTEPFKLLKMLNFTGMATKTTKYLYLDYF